MARGLQNFPNIDGPDSDYPNGRIRDEDGSGNGTDINEFSNGDIQQFFAKLMRAAGIVPNGLPDNEYSGNQYFQALLRCQYKSYVARITQIITNDPTVTIMPNNTIGNIVWTRFATGNYRGTLIGAFPDLSKVYVTIAGSGLGLANIVESSNDYITIFTSDTSLASQDQILNDTAIEIRVYY